MTPRGKDDAPRRGRILARGGRALLFLAVTWSLAGSLMLLQEGLPELLSRAAQRGWVPYSLLAPPAPGVDCSAAVERAMAARSDPDVTRQAALLVWLLGAKLGFAAGLVDAYAGSANQPDVEPWMDEPRRLAAALRVETPVLPKMRHTLDVLHEFTEFVAADPQCVAAQLAGKYSPRHAALYRFAQIAGHAAVYRITAPQLGPSLVPELRFYATAAELPNALWQPLIEDSIDSLPGATVKDKVLSHMDRIAQHLRSGG